MKVTWVKDQEVKERPVNEVEEMQSFSYVETIVPERDADSDILSPAVLNEMVDYTDDASFFSVETRYVPPAIDKSWVGRVLTFMVKNETRSAWEKCYPGAFWVRWGERIPGPASKDQCLGNIAPGATVHFRIVVPIFPTGEKPDALRIAILEDGVCWHTVEDIEVR